MKLEILVSKTGVKAPSVDTYFEKDSLIYKVIPEVRSLHPLYPGKIYVLFLGGDNCPVNLALIEVVEFDSNTIVRPLSLNLDGQFTPTLS